MPPHPPFRVFLDCEFTDLQAPKLLSIGMVSDTGARLYVELDLSSPQGRKRLARASEFTREQVLEFFGYDAAAQVRTTAELGHRAAEWLLSLGVEGIELVHDYPADYELLLTELKAQPNYPEVQALLHPHNVAEACDCVDAERATDARFAELRSEGLYRHHALADALALQAAYAAAFEEEAC